jgi:hypothetical protein
MTIAGSAVRPAVALPIVIVAGCLISLLSFSPSGRDRSWAFSLRR